MSSVAKWDVEAGDSRLNVTLSAERAGVGPQDEAGRGGERGIQQLKGAGPGDDWHGWSRQDTGSR